MSFAIATIRLGNESVAAIVHDRRVWPIHATAKAAGMDVPPGSLFDFLQQWDTAWPALQALGSKIASGGVPDIHALFWDEVHLETPIQMPRKLFCIGANYQDHLEEMNAPKDFRPNPNETPFFYLKPGSTAVVGPGPTVHIPAKCEIFDWEAELAAVFGKRGRAIPAARALEYVAGYTLAIDFTSRNEMATPKHVFKWNLVLGKCQDAMTPVGPVFVPSAFVDGDDFQFQLSVNGVLKQRGATRDMIYSIPKQVAGVSEGITIEPGDLMLTGSPAGVGMPRGEKLSPGDVVVIESAATGPMQVIIQEPLGTF